MPTPVQLLAVISGAHADTAFFALCCGAALLWGKVRCREKSWVPTATLLQAALVGFCTVTMVELLAPIDPTMGVQGTLRCLILRAVLLIAGGGVGFMLVSHRVRRSRLRARLRRLARSRFDARLARARAEASTRAKSDFVASLCHELRTPLHALIASAEAVLKMPIDNVQRAFVGRIVKESTRLGRTLNESLDLRRVEEFPIALDCAPTAPGDIARDLVDLFSARAHEKGLDLLFDCDLPTGFQIAGDGRRFRQVLANLIDNAIKFTTRGTVRVRISYIPASTAGTVALLTVAVSDCGLGVAVDQRAALIAGNMEQPSASGLPASSLGLAIAQRLVRLMGGEVTARSVPAEGSEFGFTIPVSVLNAPTAALPGKAPDRRDGCRRVLIVDDVAANRILLQMFLEQQGFSADYASGGEEAVRLAARNRYDAILMDLHMPVVDGFAATLRIRAAEPAADRAVIVAVTASGDQAMRDKCLSAGMDGHFAKPLDLRKFCGELTDLIAARQTVQL